MAINQNHKERRLIWTKLSALYLDTEILDRDLNEIAMAIHQSPFSMREARRINRYEVFPSLFWNLWSPAGEWSGFDQEWLYKRISITVAKSGRVQRIRTDILFFIFHRRQEHVWKRIEQAHSRLAEESS